MRSGWVIKANDPEFPHSNWNSWMKRINANDAKQSTQIEVLPVIEGDPNDLDTIFTTLKELLRLAGFAIVTFDFPIWLNAVNIIKQANLPIIARLGGFHVLKSYLGSMGYSMEDSGLLDVIQLIYPGSTTANHIMDEGCFDKTIRAHLLIDAAIYQHIMKLAFNEEERGDMKTLMEKMGDRKMGTRHSDSVVPMFEQRFEENFKRLANTERPPTLCTCGVPPHGRCDEGLYQNQATCRPQWASVLHCYQDASHLCRFRPSSLCEGRTAVLSTHKRTQNFACLQRNLTTPHCPRERCLLLKS